MQFKAHNYQQYCIDKILTTPKVGLFLDMGLGKTVTTLTAIKILKYEQLVVGKCLIIAPKSVAEATWSTEANKWDHTKELKVVKVLGTEKQRERALDEEADIYVTNRENVVWLEEYLGKKWCFDMVVLDESSSFKSPQAKRWKSMRRLSGQINRLVLLTGTPSPNGLEDLWAQIYLLDKGLRLESSITKYREHYFKPDKRGPNGVIFSWRLKDGAEESILKSIDDICVSMKAEDYLELPELIEDVVTVHMGDKSKKLYDDMERDYILELDEDEISATSAAALMTKLLQISNGAVYDEEHNWTEVNTCKLKAFEELMESLEGHPALVFYNYQHDKERILKCLKKKNVRCLETPKDIDDWNSGKIDVLLAHPASAAYGLNLQQGGNHVVWFGLTWNYEQYVQANARLHRQGQKSTVIVHLLVCEGTRDEDVIRALEHKDDVQSRVMESLKARIKEIRAK